MWPMHFKPSSPFEFQGWILVSSKSWVKWFPAHRKPRASESQAPSRKILFGQGFRLFQMNNIQLEHWNFTLPHWHKVSRSGASKILNLAPKTKDNQLWWGFWVVFFTFSPFSLPHAPTGVIFAISLVRDLRSQRLYWFLASWTPTSTWTRLSGIRVPSVASGSNLNTSQLLETMDGLGQELVNYGPSAESGPSPDFVDEVLLELSSLLSIPSVCLPSCRSGRADKFDRGHTAHKA